MTAHVIVVGNEKGGSGKTTTAMHLIISLLKLGFKVGSMDIDSRQQSLTRYVENRVNTKNQKQMQLDVPEHKVITKSRNADLALAQQEEEQSFLAALTELKVNNDFIVIDTPGSDSPLSRLAHSNADTVITPINDSFIDVDLIGKVRADDLDVITPGIYSAMFWEQKLKRAARDKGEIKWIVVRNRLLANIETINQRNIEFSLEKLSKKFGFLLAPGFSDRVIFKELFLHGLTLHDTGNSIVKMNPSMIAARQELRNFMHALKIKEITDKLGENLKAKKSA
jgi:chromosome partitioning protein